MKSFLSISIAVLFLFIGCSKRIEPVKVGEMNEYKDPAYGFKIKYPKCQYRRLIENLFDILSNSFTIISVLKEKIKRNAAQD